MSLFSQINHSLGLEVSSSGIIGVELFFSKGKPQFKRFINVSPPPGDTRTLLFPHVKPLYTDSAYEKISFQNIRDNPLVITALPTSEVLTRPLEIKLSKDRDVNAVFTFQAEPLLPYPAETALLEKVKVEQSLHQTLLTLLAVKVEHLKNHLELWQAYGIDPEIVSCVPLALSSFSTACLGSNSSCIVLHIGLQQISCVLVKKSKLIASQAIFEGIESLKLAYAKDCESLHIENPPSFVSHHDNSTDPLDFQNLSSFSTLQSTTESIRQEIARTIYALAKQGKIKEMTPLFVCGEGSTCSNLPYVLCQGLNTPLTFPCDEGIPGLRSSQLQEHAISLGLSLIGLQASHETQNFRKREFSYPAPWKRYKKPILAYYTICLFASFMLYLFGQVLLGYHEDKLKEDYGRLIIAMDKPYEMLEVEFQRKNPTSTPLEIDQLPNLKTLNKEDLASRIHYLQKELQATPEVFPLIPNTPRVSDVLAWLSIHPRVVETSPDGTLNPLLQIESFSYLMIKRPEVGKKDEKYQVKVELEFSSPTPKLAREFHDALITPNHFVDSKGEVKWSTNRGKYRTSFYLKDKTTYPTSILGGNS